MKRNFVLILTIVFLYNSALFSQASPESDMASPLDIPLILSGTFGELRGNHFHAGIDIKTNGRTGCNVFSIEDGYVSRISVSPGGYGKALYVDHPNGLTSVYAHLDKFAPEIQKHVKKIQYERESYTVNIYPEKNDIRVNKKQLIAISGNTGGSGGPHLHFEIRTTANQKPQNPLSFNYKIKDSRAPILSNIHVYEFDNKFTKADTLMEVNLNLNKNENQYEASETVKVSSGWIGFGVNSVDRLDDAYNKNGVYSVKLFVDNKLYFSYAMDELVFNEQYYINSFIDYEYYLENYNRIQKLFIEPNNKLSIYNVKEEDGYLFVEEGKKYDIFLIVEDYEGNKTKSRFSVEGAGIKRHKPDKASLILDFRNENIITTDRFELSIPKGALYKEYDFDYGFENGVYKVGTKKIPMHQSFDLKLNIGEIADSVLASKTVAGRLNKNGDTLYAGGTYNNGSIYLRSKYLGDFVVSVDTVLPEVKYLNIHNGKWMTKENYIELKITDDFSGISSYECYIDDKWALFEYDAKNNYLAYDFNDLELEGKKHRLKVRIKDNVGNIKEEEITFYR